MFAQSPVALPGATPGMERALDAYAAAGTVLDGARDVADLAGVVALVEEGTAPIRAAMNAARPRRRRLLSRRPVPAPPHTPLTRFFNPFRGLATTGDAIWRMLGRRGRLTVAVCAECAADLAARRTPEPLTVRHEGRLVAYYEVPGGAEPVGGDRLRLPHPRPAGPAGEPGRLPPRRRTALISPEVGSTATLSPVSRYAARHARQPRHFTDRPGVAAGERRRAAP
ncbi:hypothetical protein ACH5AU_12840 [Streptomyces albidoflavus]